MIYLDPPHPNIDLCCKICISLGPTDAIQTKINPTKTFHLHGLRTCCLKTPSVSQHPNVGPGVFGKDQKLKFHIQNYHPPPRKTTLPETNIEPENGWLESWKMSFFLGFGLFSGANC